MLKKLTTIWKETAPIKTAGGFVDKNAQSVAGVLSLSSATTLAFNGDLHSIIAAGLATTGVLALMFGKESTGSYSAAALAFIATNTSLYFSPTIDGNTHLKASIIALNAGWMFGTLRWPIEHIAKSAPEKIAKTLNKTSNVIRTGVAINGITLKAPIAIAAASGGNEAIALSAAISLTQDLLLGRVHDHFKNLIPEIEDVEFFDGDTPQISSNTLYIPRRFKDDFGRIDLDTELIIHPAQDVTGPQSRL